MAYVKHIEHVIDLEGALLKAKHCIRASTFTGDNSYCILQENDTVLVLTAYRMKNKYINAELPVTILGLYNNMKYLIFTNLNEDFEVQYAKS